MNERTMTQDEQAGIDWFNALPERERAGWLKKAGSAIPADAWAAFKLSQKYSYEITPRPPELGGGWRLRLIEDGQEVGGGVFPPVEGIEDAEEADQAAYDDAAATAFEWYDPRAPADE